MTLNNLGVLYRNQNRMAEARIAFDESLEIRRHLARENPVAYLGDLAGSLVSVGGPA